MATFFFFTFGIKKRQFLQAFRDTSARISNVKFCTEAPLYLHKLKLSFLHGPEVRWS